MKKFLKHLKWAHKVLLFVYLSAYWFIHMLLLPIFLQCPCSIYGFDKYKIIYQISLPKILCYVKKKYKFLEIVSKNWTEIWFNFSHCKFNCNTVCWQVKSSVPGFGDTSLIGIWIFGSIDLKSDLLPPTTIYMQMKDGYIKAKIIKTDWILILGWANRPCLNKTAHVRCQTSWEPQNDSHWVENKKEVDRE